MGGIGGFEEARSGRTPLVIVVMMVVIVMLLVARPTSSRGETLWGERGQNHTNNSACLTLFRLLWLAKVCRRPLAMAWELGVLLF